MTSPSRFAISAANSSVLYDFCKRNRYVSQTAFSKVKALVCDGDHVMFTP